jgi:hypothetical protein
MASFSRLVPNAVVRRRGDTGKRTDERRLGELFERQGAGVDEPGHDFDDAVGEVVAGDGAIWLVVDGVSGTAQERQFVTCEFVVGRMDVAPSVGAS